MNKWGLYVNLDKRPGVDIISIMLQQPTPKIVCTTFVKTTRPLRLQYIHIPHNKKTQPFWGWVLMWCGAGSNADASLQRTSASRPPKQGFSVLRKMVIYGLSCTHFLENQESQLQIKPDEITSIHWMLNLCCTKLMARLSILSQKVVHFHQHRLFCCHN